MTRGLVGNIQRYSIHDGPGIRTTVFLKGCPLSCLWCHNPENRAARPEIALLPARCIRCGACAEACPQEGALPAADAAAAGRRSAACTLCGSCVQTCPVDARQWIGNEMSVMGLLDEILKDQLFFDQSGGGVTFSGGEPLVQEQFLVEMLELCGERGIHTAVDTCGFAARETLLAVAARALLFLYDLKAVDEEKHRRFTGVTNLFILENLRALAHAGARIWLRIPIIPGFNDSEEEVEAMAGLAASLPAIEQINLLPYHRTALHKFKRLGQDYPLADIIPSPAGKIESIVSRFKSRGLAVILGG